VEPRSGDGFATVLTINVAVYPFPIKRVHLAMKSANDALFPM
jgi:hypothetical protein